MESRKHSHQEQGSIKVKEGTEKTVNQKELLLKVFTQYPFFHRGLEMCCGDGQRVRTGRYRGLNLYGTETDKRWANSWLAQGIDPYIRVCPSYKTPFEDESFDFVIHPKPIGGSGVLQEIYRIGSRSFWAKCELRPKGRKEPTEWLAEALEIGFRIEGYTISTENNLILEMRKG